MRVSEVQNSGQFPRFGLSLLGRFELTAGGDTVLLPSKKLAALLAYLACTAPEPQPREKLANLLWGSHFETQARQNLRQALFRLRRVLGQDALVNSEDDVRLAPGVVDCDAVRFAALLAEGSQGSLAAAADLYRDPLLADLNIAEDAWSDWRAAERSRLEDMAVDALVGFGQQELRSGRPASALKSANRAIAVNVLREDAHRLTIQALAAAGRKAEALRHYQDLVTLLRRELSTEPDAATQALAAELRSARSPGIPPMGEPDHGSNRAFEARTEAGIAPARADEASTPAGGGAAGLERRQLTVLACHVIAPAPLQAGLDPEDLHDRTLAFHRAVTDAAAAFHGFVAQYQGNGALVYFGYPVADEHDAERAIRAGLAIIDAVGALEAPHGITLRASVGIATGLVVVGGRPGQGDGRQPIAIGETPDLAEWLRGGAEPGEVVIAAGTRRLVGRMFDLRALPAIAVKGLPQPVAAWQVQGEAAGMSRFEARRGDASYPLVGRREEIELLSRRWEQARLGAGRVVVISGEPGIGKSRIAESLLAELGRRPHARFRYFCSPHHAHSALHPFIAHIERDADFEAGSSAAARRDRLEALLAPTSASLSRDVALVAELLGLPAEGRSPALAVDPQQKREMVLGALLGRLVTAAEQGPILIVFEDVHWMDPTSLDLLERLIARAARLPVLLIVTARPEFQPMWIGQPHVTMLPLSRLGQDDGAGIIGGVARNKALPEDIVEQILARTDGVPLFIEELTRTLLESGFLREMADSYAVDGPLPPRAIPTTLQASLAARLDPLGEARDVAVIGAAIGREFSHALIAAVSALPPTELDAALARLAASGLIARRGTPPDAHYAFRHALIQDAAYGSMLKSRRRQLHQGIAEALVEHFPALAENQPEIVAHHFAEAGLTGEAFGYWVKAGHLAQARWANREAAGFFERALHALETLPETREALEQAVDLRFDLKTSLFPLGQFQRIVGHLREAEGLARRLDDQSRLCQFYVHMCQTLNLSGNPAEAVAFGREAEGLAKSLDDVPLQVAASLFLGLACFSTLDYRAAEHHFLRVLDMLRGQQSLERFFLAGFPAVSARAFLTRIYADQGKFEQGIVTGEEAVRLAETVDHPYSLGIASWCLADLLVTKGELSRAIGLLERGLSVARAWNLPFLVAGNSGSLGYAYALQGRTADGPQLLEQALGVFDKMGHRFAQSLFMPALAEVYMLAGRTADALALARRALALARESGQRTGEATALRLLGEASGRAGAAEQAEGHYREGLALAGELAMRPLVARCHHGLGRLYLRSNQWGRARDHLTSARTMYRDLGMGFWLAQAETEIGQLR
ncbi:MAG: AAA family ATPase [Rhizobiales bacterium]|nr:AAA family ATPase [Hyphomicrobiales bacterium]